MEEEKKLQAERRRMQNLYEMEQQKQRNKEVSIFVSIKHSHSSKGSQTVCFPGTVTRLNDLPLLIF